MRKTPILGAEKPGASLGPERFEATCQGKDGEECGRTWAAEGTIRSRDAVRRAQKHADRTGHSIAAEWANRR